MLEYIYIVKCPDCADEHFHFFDDAKACAMGSLSSKPIITQVEVNRNDFGECTDSADLGTVWSWEDAIGRETGAEPTVSVFNKGDFDEYANDSEFDDDEFYFDHGLVEEVAPVRFSFRNNEDRKEFFKLCSEIGIITGADLKKFMEVVDANDGNLLDKLREYRDGLGDDFKIAESRKPIPEGMTIEQLVEEMEENEDEVECAWCNELYGKDQCRKEVDLGWLCSRCEAAIKSRGETLTFRENNYWDFLDEDIEKPVAEDLDWHTYKITFTTKANPDNEQTTTFKTWQSDVEYAWRKSNANIPHTTVKNIELIEGLEEEYSFSDMVADSIRHLTNDLGKDPMADDFADDVLKDIEDNYDVDFPDNPEDYRNWASEVSCEVSRQLNRPSSVLEAIEEPDEYSKRLTLCPECGEASYDAEAGLCISCGFN